jgi:hypothetical protein
MVATIPTHGLLTLFSRAVLIVSHEAARNEDLFICKIGASCMPLPPSSLESDVLHLRTGSGGLLHI